MEDESGYARYSYDAMGNVSENCRTFVLPAEDNAYTFIMNTEYDTWGRTLSITYPDKERVSYAYDFGGNLKSVSSAKNGNDKSLVDSIRYDKFGDRTAIYFGNGTTQHYSYNPTSRRLGNLQGRTATNVLMQDIIYEYDAVGNVTKTDNAAVAIGTLGGPYSCAYTYDHLNRLTATNCQQGNVGYTEQRTYLDDGRIATYDLNGTRQGYSYNTTQPHTLSNIHTLPNRASDVLFSFAWDAKGNMTAQNSQGGSQRNLVWDERNRMLGMVDNATSGNAAHYVYDAQGERTFKLTGYSNHTGSGETSETYVSLDEPTLYASPYLTATATGYTKHYFAGTERLASAIGNGGLADIGNVNGTSLADKRMERDSLLRRVMAPYPLRINRNRLDTLYAMTRPDTTAELTYFFHPDHLGSASWITDLSGQPVQHLQYKPFGGDYIDQQDPNTEYSERFRFTGKERDAETGYDYFGARYYSSSLGIWLSVDPMSDKYPGLSPFVYCADNPMRLVDPDGRNPVFFIARKVAAYYGTAMAMEYCGRSSRVRQAGYAMQHPINAVRVGQYNQGSNNISTIASNFQVNVANAAGLRTGNEGDQGNAYRHALWQGIITNEMGARQAQRIGNAHEDNLKIDLNQRTFKNMEEADKAVDLLNNLIGREIGIDNKGASNKTIAIKVAKEFYENGLWTASLNKDGSATIEKTKITREQYNAAIIEINKKGNNGLNK